MHYQSEEMRKKKNQSPLNLENCIRKQSYNGMFEDKGMNLIANQKLAITDSSKRNQ
jgi:hypothetical protein